MKLAWAHSFVDLATYCLVRKLKATWAELKRWNKELFGVLQVRIRVVEEELDALECNDGEALQLADELSKGKELLQLQKMRKIFGAKNLTQLGLP